MQEKEKAEREHDFLNFLELYGLKIAAVSILILVTGLAFPIIFSKIFTLEKVDRGTLEKLYFLSGCFYSVTGFVTLFLIIGIVIYTSNQLKQNARQNAWDNLFSTFDMIDLYIARHEKEIKKAGINQKYKPRSGNAGFLLLIHDIDLIYRYWIHQKALTPDERKGFENWIDVMFFNWIAEHKDKLLVDYEVIVDRKDLYSEKFLCWLKEQQANSVSLKNVEEKTDTTPTESDSWENLSLWR